MKKLSDAKKSVLGNMIIRQTMGGTRKEDDINNLDADGFRNYFYEHYDCIFEYGPVDIIISEMNLLYFNILFVDGYLYKFIYDFKNNKPQKIFLQINKHPYNKIYEKNKQILDKYNLKYNDLRGYELIPDKKITNQYALKFIDDIIKMGDKPIWKKKKQEDD